MLPGPFPIGWGKGRYPNSPYEPPAIQLHLPRHAELVLSRSKGEAKHLGFLPTQNFFAAPFDRLRVSSE